MDWQSLPPPDSFEHPPPEPERDRPPLLWRWREWWLCRTEELRLLQTYQQRQEVYGIAWLRIEKRVLRRGFALLLLFPVLFFPAMLLLSKTLFAGLGNGVRVGVLAGLCLTPIACLLYRYQRRLLLPEIRDILNTMSIPICRQCGYDMRGCSSAQCPECGTPFEAPRTKPKPRRESWFQRWWQRRLSRIEELHLLPSHQQQQEVYRLAYQNIRGQAFRRSWRYMLVLMGLVLFLERIVPDRLTAPFLGSYVSGLIRALMAALVYIWLLSRDELRLIRREIRNVLNTMGVPICRECGYDMRGGGSPKCPECGAPFEAGSKEPDPPRRSLRQRWREWRLSRIEELRLVATPEEREWVYRQASQNARRQLNRSKWNYWRSSLLFAATYVVLELAFPGNALTPFLHEFWALCVKAVLACLPEFYLRFRDEKRSTIREIRNILYTMGIPICRECGYDMRGGGSPKCPECGAPFDPSPASAELAAATSEEKVDVMAAEPVDEQGG